MIEFPHQTETFLLPGPAGQLEVMTTRPDKLVAAVAIICHPHPLKEGTMHNKVVTILAKAFDKLGFATVRFNYRGVGNSEGSYGNMEGEIEDLLAIKTWVSQVLPEADCCLAGFSFGGFIAASVAHQLDDIKCLVTVAPAINHADFSALAHIHCPWLVIHGDQDDIVPYDQVLALSQNPPSPMELLTVSDTGHFFHGKLVLLQQMVMGFLYESF